MASGKEDRPVSQLPFKTLFELLAIILMGLWFFGIPAGAFYYCWKYVLPKALDFSLRASEGHSALPFDLLFGFGALAVCMGPVIALLIFLIRWYVSLVRSLRGIRSESRLIKIVAANYLVFLILLNVLGDHLEKMVLHFLGAGGEIEFSFKWNQKCGDRIPDEWMEAFCKTSPCKGKLILKTEEEVLLRSPSTKRYLSIPRFCIVEVPASEKTDS